MKSLVVSRRAAMLLVSHLVKAVSCAQRASSAGTLPVEERPRRPLVPLWRCSSMDNGIPIFEGIESTGVEMWSKRSESSANDCAQSGAGISSEGACELYPLVFLSALFLHTSTDCSHSFQCCNIRIGSSLQQKSHPRCGIATFMQLVRYLLLCRSGVAFFNPVP